MAEPRIECIELATAWEKNHGDCYKHCTSLRERVERLVHRIYSTFNEQNRLAVKEYLDSIGVAAPQEFMEGASAMTNNDVLLIEEQLREQGTDLNVRRFQEISSVPKTLGDAFYLERWSKRELAATAEWAEEIANKLGYGRRPSPVFQTYSEEIRATAKKIEIAGDGLDVLHSIDGRPTCQRTAILLSAALTELTHPDAWRQCFSRLLHAHREWWNDQVRLLNWLIFKDQKLKVDFDPIETALITKPRLLARYRLLKERKYAVSYSSIIDRDDLWDIAPEERTDETMKRALKSLQEFLNKQKFDHVTLIVTAHSAHLKTE